MATGRQETLLSDFCLKAVGNKIYTFGKHLPIKWNHLCLAKSLKWKRVSDQPAVIWHELWLSITFSIEVLSFSVIGLLMQVSTFFLHELWGHWTVKLNHISSFELLNFLLWTFQRWTTGRRVIMNKQRGYWILLLKGCV